MQEEENTGSHLGTGEGKLNYRLSLVSLTHAYEVENALFLAVLFFPFQHNDLANIQ